MNKYFNKVGIVLGKKSSKKNSNEIFLVLRLVTIKFLVVVKVKPLHSNFCMFLLDQLTPYKNSGSALTRYYSLVHIVATYATSMWKLIRCICSNVFFFIQHLFGLYPTTMHTLSFYICAELVYICGVSIEVLKPFFSLEWNQIKLCV